MAEYLAVGLSKTVVAGALAKVQSAIDEDAKLRETVQRDLVSISLEFEMIQSFLNFAHEEMAVRNYLAATWVRRVRELAYDLEDCVEFIIHLDDKPIFWLRLLPHCIAPVLPVDQAVAEIQVIKGRAEELSKCYLRYSHITDDSAGSKLVMMQQQASSRAAAITASNMLAKARDATGRQQGLRDLTQIITKKDDWNLQVLSLWGTGGDHGMTPIVRKAYHAPEICRSFACRAWVKLMHPFNPHEFVRRFMAQVYANACEDKGANVGVHFVTKMEAKQQDLLKEFVQELNSKTYLVILENLTDMLDWDAVRMFLPDMKNGSWIIVSTQQLEIASLCVGPSYRILELKQFTAEHSVCALFQEGSQDYRVKDKSPIVCHLHSSHRDMIPTFKRDAIVHWMEKYPFVGRESEMNELRRYTARERLSNSQVISVWGIPGIGKSALVRNLYHDRILRNHKFSNYSWVDVSHPFDLRDFCRSLLSDFHSENDPIKQCQDLLREHSCLLVIDDLQSREEWDLIQSALVSRHSASFVIVISTEASVATYCTKEERVFNVKGLETAAAFDIFRKEVHRKKPSSPLTDHKDADVEELILKCGGIPEVIVSIAASLATQTASLMDTIRSLNHTFMHHLETDLVYGSLQGLFCWMHSYFHTSPDSLKPCIFYLPIFPRGQIIRRRRLVRRWIAEGYSRDNVDKSAEERAEEFFSRLIDLSIIQQTPQETATTAQAGTRLALCQVNGFIREYIVSRQVEDNLVFELGGSSTLTTQRTGRHLVILESWDRDMIVFNRIDFSRLRSLTVFGKWESFFVSKSMKTLRVLDLEDASGVADGDLEKIVKLLQRLKFLSLRGRREICHLPSSLGDLRPLQTLDVRGTSIGSLPATITKLHKLQYIRAGTKGVPAQISPASSSSWFPMFRKHHLVGVEVPSGIGKLTALHTLGVVNVVASGGKAIVEELKKLTQLRKLGVSGINRKNYKGFISAISSHVHLDSLSVWLDKDSQDCLDGMSLPWENLRSLKLYGLQDKLPQSRSHLSMLRKLDLEMDTLQKHDIEFLAMLPELRILRFQVKQLQDDRLDFYADMCGEQLITFKTVKILKIGCSSSRLHITFGSRSMKKLELLKIDCSSALCEFTGLDHLSKLRQVLLMGTTNEAFKTDLQSQLDSHPNTPVVKLEERCLS